MATSRIAANAQGANAEMLNVNEQSVEQPNEVVTTTNNGADKYKLALAKLKEMGGITRKGIKVKNVNATEKDNYTMISFTLGQDVKGFVAKDDGTFVEGERNIIFGSMFAIAGAMKEDEELSWMANHMLLHPNIVNLIFNGGTIDIVQVPVSAGEVYVNPFTTKSEPDEVTFDHDTIINHIVGIHLGKMGQKFADKLADKLLGF